ncbi:MAG TPA: hypothetical protein VF530_22855 [Planctomycetota bacterium]
MRPALLCTLTLLVACHSDSDSAPTPAPEPIVHNLGLAAGRIWGTNELRLVAASEPDQGQDLDGDGDQDDLVLHLLQLEGQGLINTGLALPPRFQRDEVPPPQFGCSDALGVFQVSEAATGLDLDQDGLADEISTWIFDRRTGALRDLGFAHSALVLGGDVAAFHGGEPGEPALVVLDARDGSLTLRPVAPQLLLGVHEGVVAFTRWEEGAFDLNADGDSTDLSVLHLYDADSTRVVNASFDLARPEVRFAGDFVGFHVSEPDSGAIDLNGDGDAEDRVFVALDVRGRAMHVLDAAGAEFAELPGPGGSGFLLTLPEDDGDRNGDGDRLDRVMALYDPVTDRLIDTGLATGLGLGLLAERWLGVLVLEGSQGQGDLDGDGLLESAVPHVFDTRTGQSVNLGFSGFWIGAYEDQLLAVTRLSGSTGFELVVWNGSARAVQRPGVDARNILGSADGRALLSLREHDEDLNGDGDTADFVLALHDRRTGAVRSLGLATSTFQGSLGPDGQAAVLVSETAQGVDLNGDGDLLDQVLHVVSVARP